MRRRRATKGIDIWARPSTENVRRLVAAFGEFGFPTEGVTADGLLDGNQIWMLGRVPNRIDVITRPLGIDWEGACGRRGKAQYGSVPIPVVSRADLIAAKRAAGRPRDLADVATLEAILAREESL